jgi:tRNA dimethylallyltransferase
MKAKTILIAGPTASGKSALALEMARQYNGVIINADAMQIYAGLPILTAQPSAKDQAIAPHELYGVLDPVEKSSVARWLGMTQDRILQAQTAGQTPIIVGGTGLYFKALLGGLADIPDIPSHVRDEAQKLYDGIGEEKFRAELARLDPDSAAKLARNDRQRLVRAFEVVKHTGKTIAHWQNKGIQVQEERCDSPPLVGGVRGGVQQKTKLISGGSPPLPKPLPTRGRGFTPHSPQNHFYESHLLLPERETLYASCNHRFESMIQQGAIDEVREFLKHDLNPELPAMKTIGVREIGSYLRGEMSLEDAIAKAQQLTRNYAKRQMTWFRNQWKQP